MNYTAPDDGSSTSDAKSARPPIARAQERKRPYDAPEPPRRGRLARTALWVGLALLLPLVPVWLVYGTVHPCGVMKHEAALYMTSGRPDAMLAVLGPVVMDRFLDSMRLSPVQCAVALVNRKLPHGKKIPLRWSLFGGLGNVKDAFRHDDGYRE